jgi:peptidoglycan/xylan/chitin deacetylase (PgdA/CDA1 family)
MGRTKELLSVVTNNPVSGRVMRILEGLQKERPNLLRVLTYHQVESSADFMEQMDYLAVRYQVVSMAQVIEAVLGGEPLPPRSILITFDDAYRNFTECAWPVLKQFDFPVTMFVPTGFPDQADQVFWWDRLNFAFNNTTRRDSIQTPVGELSLATEQQRHQAFLRLKNKMRSMPHSELLAWTYQLCRELDTHRPESEVLSWDELRRLAEEGVTLGAHSQSHAFMDQLTRREVETEAKGSLKDLEREIGPTLPIFAYPSGRFGEDTVQVLRQAGFVLAFTTIRGVNDLHNADPLRLRRINIGRKATLPVLRARLLHSAWLLNQLRPLPN